MEYYLVITNAAGESRIVPISDVSETPVNPGDDVVVMDGDGNPVDVSLRPDEEDLILTFPDGETAKLLDFYEIGEGDEPITISLNPKLPEDTSYEFNSQTGNLPDGMGFSLMRFSNTEYVQFVEQIDELAVGTLLAGLSNSGPRGGAGGGDGGATDVPGDSPPIDLILDPVPRARPDSGSGLEDGAPIVINLLRNDVDERGEGLVIHSVGGIDVEVGSKVTLSSGTVITVGEKTVSVEPGEEFDRLQVGEFAEEKFVYTIRDAGGNVDTSHATVTIFGVNDPPMAEPDLFSVGEDAPVTVDILQNDSDPDTPDTLTVTEVTDPAAGTVTVNSDNSLTFDPNGEFESLGAGETATVTVTYTISDDSGATASSTATFVVEGANDTPDAMDDTSVVSESNPLTIDVLANDTDPDVNDSLTITGITQPGQGSVWYNAEDLTFDPSSDFEYLGAGESETVTFTYDISDGKGGTDTANVTVTVTGEDDPTVTNPDTAVTDEETAVLIDVLGNDTDPDDTLTVDSVAQPTDPNDGTVVNNGGTDVTFTPGSNFNSLAEGESATTTFTYTTNTGSTETVTVTVNGVNDTPSAVDDMQTTDQNTSIRIDATANDSDPDTSDTLLIVGVDQPSLGSVSVDSGNQIVFNPGDDFDYLDDGESITVAFDYTISDGNGGTDTATVTVTVNGVDDATVTTPDVDITDEDTAVTIDVLANDSDVDDTLVIASVDQPVDGNDGTVVNNGGADVTFTPGSNFESLGVGESATTTFTYTTNTGTTETVTVTVHGVNDEPAAVDDDRTTDQDTPLVIDAVANDTDPDTSDDLLIVGVDQPTSGSVSINASNQLVFDPGNEFDSLDAGESATVTFDYTISDGNGGTDTATVTVTINGTDDALDADPDSASTTENTQVTIDVLDNDSDPDTTDNPLAIDSFEMTTSGGGTVSQSGNNLVFDPGTDFDDLAVDETEVVTFDYTVVNQDGATATETVTITVRGTNDAPVAVNDTDAVDEDATLVVSAANGVIQGLGTDTDADTSDTLTVVGVKNSSNLGALVGNPLLGVYGTLTLNEDGSYSYAADQDAADPLAVGETANDVFSYTISDGNGGTDTATLTITVTGTNDVPIANPPGGTAGVDPGVYDDADTIAEDDVAPAAGNVLANDVDLDASDVLIVSEVNGSVANVDNSVNGTFGDITIEEDGDYTYNLDNTNATVQGLAVGETLTETFTYTADDQNGGTATATLTITITGTNDVPIANPPGGMPGVDPGVYDDTDSISEDAFPNTTDGNVLANDLDPDGDTLTVVEVNNSGANVGSQISGAYGAVTIRGDGSYQYVLDNGNSAVNGLDDGEMLTDTFFYTASDGNGGTATAELTITINGTDDATVITPDAGETDEDTSVTIDVLANDSDVDDALTVASVDDSGLPGDASVTNNGTDVTFNPGTAFNDLAVGETEIVTFTYTTNTGATETVTVTVNGTNDAPTAVADDRTTDQDTPLVIDAVANDIDPDTSDDLIIIGVDQPASGSVSINASNQLVFDPGDDFDSLDETQSATVTFDYTISDGNGGTDTATVTVTVNGIDDATVINPDAGETDEDTSVTIDVLGNDSDVDDTLTVASVDDTGLPGDASVTNNGTDVTFNPGTAFNDLALGETEIVTFTYTTNTGSTETVTVTVNGVNDAPTAVDDTESTDQDSVVNIDLLGAADSVAADSDPDGDALAVTQINGIVAGGTITLASGALLTVNGNGTVDYDPNGQFTSLDQDESVTDSFTYTISDGNGGTATATATVTINGVDDALVASPDSATTGENTPATIDVLDNDDDPDTTDNPLAIDSFDPTTSGGGSVSQVGENLVFDPGTDFDDLSAGETEVVTFDYTVVNQDGATATETVTVTVTGANDAPTAVDDTESVTQNGSTNIDLLGAGDSVAADSDPDGDTLSITVVDGKTAGGTVGLTSGALLTMNANGTADYNPNGAFDYLDTGESAVDTFVYTISDGNGGTDTATVTVTISGADDALTTDDDTGSTTENAPVVIDVLANDDDPDTTDNPLAVQSVSQPAMGSVTNNGTDVTFDPGTDFDYLAVGESATVTFSYTAVNQDGDTAVESVTVTVNGENDGPETHEDTLHTIEGVGRSVDVIQNDSDPDSPQLTITAIDGVAVTANQPYSLSSGAIVTVMEDGRVYFNPNGVYNPLGFGETGMETFTYTVTDSEGATATEDVSVIIDGVDNEVAFSGAYQVLSNQLFDIQLDPIDESIIYVPIGDPLPFNFNSIAFNANDGFIYANATENDAGSGTVDGDIIQIDPFTGRVVNNLGQLVNDQGESIPNFAGAINSDLGLNGIWYVNGDPDSSGNRTYAVDLDSMSVTGIGDLPGADYGVDVTTGLIWSVQGNNSYSLDPTSGVVTTYTHGGLQDDGVSGANGTFGSMFADGDGNIQVTSNSGFGLYRLDTSDGSLTRVTDAPATTSNDATGTFVSTLPSASPFVFLDADGSTQPATNQDAVRNYDPTGGPVSIADTDAAIADLDGNTIASARIVLTNTLENDLLTINGPLPGGITGTVAMEGGFLVATLTGDASQQDYANAIEAVTFSNTSTGSVSTDVRAIDVTVTDVDGVRSNTATSLIFVGAGSGVISGRDVQSQDDAYSDSLVVTEDDNDPITGGARLNLLQNDSDNPSSITGIGQPPSGEGLVTDNGDGTATFNPGDDFHYLSEGETAISTFTYTTDTGETELVTVTIHGVDDPLEAAADSSSTDAASPVSIDVLANDEDLDNADNPLTLSAVTQPAGGTVSIVGNQAVFDPGNDFDGLAVGETATVTFIYTVTNADGIDENELVTVTVNGIGSANSPPTANNDSVTTDQDSTLNIDVLGNDTDPDSGDTLTVTGVSQPGPGSVVNSGTDLIFVPGGDFDYLDAGESATVTFTYTISDGNGESDTATVTVTVNGLEDATVTAPDSDGTDEDTAVTIDVLANDSDVDISDNPLSITSVTQPTDVDDGTVVNNSGDVTFTPGSNFQSLDVGESATTTFTYTTDTGTTETVTVIVSGLQDPTITTPDSGTTDEDTAVTIDVLANDSDADSKDNPLSIASVNPPIDANDGTVVNNGSDVTFTPGSKFDSLGAGQSATTTFTYTTDTGATETVTVTVNGVNDPPSVSSDVTSGMVYESGLPDGTGTSPTTTIVTGSLTAADGDGDPLTVRVDGTDVGVLDGNAATVLGTVAGDDGNGEITFFGDGSWQYELLNDAAHDTDDSTFIASEREEFSVTVFDGTVESSPVNLTFNIVDDQVVFGTPESGTITNSAGETFTGDLGVTGADSDNASLTGSIPGWDGMTTTFAASTLTSQGDTIYYYVDPADESVLIAYTDSSGSPSAYDASNPNQTLVFDLEARPLTNDYELTISQPIDNVESVLVDFSVLSASGPQSEYRFTDGPSLLSPGDPVPPGETVIFSAYGVDPTDNVNSNASYMGLNNNLVDPHEAGVAVDFVTEGRSVEIAYSFNGGGSNTMISWVAYDVDDVTVIGSGTHDAGGINNGSFTVEVNWSVLGKVEISSFDSNTKAFRIASISVDGADSDIPLDVNFPVTVTDQDGDFDSTSLSVAFDNPATPPIVIDMDGDGVEFDNIEDGIAFDADGDGELEQMAWADEDDAVLIYDQNDNNDVDGLDEFAFARYSDDANATDLEGLRHFDTNEDLILDANDAEFDSFKLWQDRDGDGIVDDGEMMTLREAGIESLELISDGMSYEAAGGDVFVHGEAGVNYSDGSRGTLADAEFDYEELTSEEHPLEILTESGEILDLSQSDLEIGETTPDLVEPASGHPGPETSPEFSGGAVPPTSVEDDVAAADSTMA